MREQVKISGVWTDLYEIGEFMVTVALNHRFMAIDKCMVEGYRII